VGVHAGQILLGHSNEMGKGCVACVGEKGDAYRVLVGKPGRKRSLGT
jgi:hypothetical protein